jgi:hypothetical protein
MFMEGEVVGLQCCRTFVSKLFIMCIITKHTNVDALNRNLGSTSKEDEDFGNDI